MPANMPKSLQELRIHENQITKIKKASFQGMAHVIVMGMKSNTQLEWQRMARWHSLGRILKIFTETRVEYLFFITVLSLLWKYYI